MVLLLMLPLAFSNQVACSTLLYSGQEHSGPEKRILDVQVSLIRTTRARMASWQTAMAAQTHTLQMCICLP